MSNPSGGLSPPPPPPFQHNMVTTNNIFRNAESQTIEARAHMLALKKKFSPIKAKVFNILENSDNLDESTIRRALNEVVPQGVNFSHTIHVPFMDQFFSIFSRASLPDMLKHIVSGYRMALIGLLVAHTFYAYGTRKKNKTQRKANVALRFTIISALLLMTWVAEYYSKIISDHLFIRRANSYFWGHLAPEWDELRARFNANNPDEGIDDNDLAFEAHTLINADLEGRGHPVVNPQGLGDFLPGLSVTALSLIYVVTGYHAKEKLGQTIINLTKTNSMQMSNVTSLFITLVNGLSELFDRLNLKTLSEFFNVECFDSLKCSNFVNKANGFIASVNAGSLNTSGFYVEVHNELIRDGKSLLVGLDKTCYDYRVVNETLTKLRNCDDKISALKASLSGDRIEPVATLFHGAPGVFKSVLCTRITRLVTKYTLPEQWKPDFEESEKDFTYCLPNDKFFDRYTNKAWSVIADDIFQRRDVVGDPDSDAVRVIKMVNSMPYVLPMSDVKEKNGTFFRSPFLFGTTNLNSFSSLESVTDFRAVERRFAIDVKVTINPKYCLGTTDKVDRTKLPLMTFTEEDVVESQATMIPNDFWTLKVARRVGDSITLYKTITFLDLVKLIVASHHERIRNYYVNREMSRIAEKEVQSELDEFFGTETSLFSGMTFNTFTPQSGMPGMFVIESAWEVNPAVCFLEAFQENNELQRSEFLHRYHQSCLSLHNEFPERDMTITGIARFLALKQFEDFIPIRDINDPKFITWLITEYGLCLNSGIDPTTGLPSIPRHVSPTPTEIISDIRTSFQPAVEFVVKHKTVILMSGLLIGSAIYWIAGFFKSVLPAPDGEEEIQPQSVDYGRAKHKVGKRVPVKLSQNVHTISVRPQAPKLDNYTLQLPKIVSADIGDCGTFSDVLTKVLNRYFFIVFIVRKLDNGETDTIRLGHATNIRGRLFAMPLHFMYQIHDVASKSSYQGAVVHFTTSTGSTQFTVSLEELMMNFKCTVSSADNDICMVDVTTAHPNSIGALNYFIKDTDLNKLKKTTSFRMTLLGSYRKPQEKNLTIRKTNTVARFQNEVVVAANWESAKEEPVYKIEDVLTYSGEFGDGDCGSLAAVEESSFNNRCLVGSHAAGSNKIGFSTLVTQESLKTMMDEMWPGITLFEQEDNSEITLNLEPIVAQGLMLPIAKVSPNKIANSVSTSEYKRSVLFGKLPHPYTVVQTYPARLRPFSLPDGTTINPMEVARENYKKHPIFVSSRFVKRAVASYESLIVEHMRTPADQRRTIPLKEALHSFDNVRSISPSTSPGYPDCLDGTNNLKHLYYKAVENNDTDKIDIYLERIANRVQDKIDKIKDGIRPQFFYKDVLKDELRTKEKVSLGKTRMFSACDFTLLILFRQYFGSFMSSYFEANHNVGSAIGINPYSKDWDAMTRKLCRFNSSRSAKNKGAGDFKKYDASQLPIILWAILDMINRWYGVNNPDNVIRSALFAEIVNSYHIEFDSIYEWKMSIPSGNPLTAMLNTIYNNVVFRLAWLFAGMMMEQFNNNVFLICLGDDNTFSVSNKYQKYFNELTLPSLMGKVGLEYTTETKGIALDEFRAIDEIEFLKRSFRYDPSLNRWVAPLNLDSIMNTMNWTKKGVIAEQITTDEIASAFYELSLHGRSTFERYAPALLELKNAYLGEYKPNRDLNLDYDYIYSDCLDTDYAY